MMQLVKCLEVYLDTELTKTQKLVYKGKRNRNKDKL